jgi:hypothetical protein
MKVLARCLNYIPSSGPGFYRVPFVAGVRDVAHFRYFVHNEEKGAFCGNQIRHHDVFTVTKSFCRVLMKFGTNDDVQQA